MVPSSHQVCIQGLWAVPRFNGNSSGTRIKVSWSSRLYLYFTANTPTGWLCRDSDFASQWWQHLLAARDLSFMWNAWPVCQDFPLVTSLWWAMLGHCCFYCFHQSKCDRSVKVFSSPVYPPQAAFALPPWCLPMWWDIRAASIEDLRLPIWWISLGCKGA